ncbi:hypothetical protein [Bacillus paramobilis]|uniref:Exosporium protein D n=1 Tax=Bacillus paramobilis TaxID=2817477 RepID=A0ABZ2VGW3_9BACI
MAGNYKDNKYCYESLKKVAPQSSRQECFISTHYTAGPGDNTPIDYLLNPGEGNVTLYQSFTSNQSNSLIQISVPLSTTPNGPLFITIESKTSNQSINDVINAGQTKLYEIADLNTIIATNGNADATTFFTLSIQNTFCLCCNSSNCD